MKLFSIILFVCGIFAVAIVASQTSYAQEAMSEEHKNRIRQNCVTSQTALSQLQVSDKLLRVNRGALYENISTKLMAPLNSRITLSRLSGLKLTATTLEYDRQIDAFRASYKEYEESMERTLKIDCADQPVEFYESVKATREKRRVLHEDTRTLTTLLKAYKTEFESFVQGFQEDAA